MSSICEDLSLFTIKFWSSHIVFFINYRRNLQPGESKLDLKKIEPQLNRLKNKVYPKKPKTSEKIAEELQKPHIREKYGKTLDKAREFYIDSVIKPTFSFHLFASIAAISFIQTYLNKPGERFYSLDGTFQVVPKGLGQLFIISIQFKNKVRWKYVEFHTFSL